MSFSRDFFSPIIHVPRRVTFFAALTGMFFGLTGFFTVISVRLITAAVSAHDYGRLRSIVIGFGIFIILYWIGWYLLRHMAWPEAVHRYHESLLRYMMDRFIPARSDELEREGSGKFLVTIQDGLYKWADMLASLVSHIPEYTILLVGLLVIVATFGYGYLIVAVGVVLFIGGVSIYYNKKATIDRRERYVLELMMTRRLTRILLSQREILFSCRKEQEIEYLVQNSRDHNDSEKRLNESLFFLFFVPHFAFGTTKILLYVLLAYTSVFAFDMSVFFTLITMIVYLEGIAFDIVRYFKDMLKTWSKVEKVYDLIESLKPIVFSLDAKILPSDCNGDYEISGVSYCYPGSSEHALRGVSLMIHHGERIGLVGVSGSGKSTLLKLLSGILTPSEGKIRFAGELISDIRPDSYFSHIGYLPQEPNVFDGTIRDNLEYALALGEKVSDEKLYAILDHASCDFVHGLPDGLDTEIGERGVRLSGGERQRLAIAKLFLKNPSVILMDEPTSALDSISEAKISESLHHLFEGRTLITIAHRLQTVAACDRLYFFENGEISESGSHQELLDLGGKYSEMVRLQSSF